MLLTMLGCWAAWAGDADRSAWEATLERVAPAVVSIEVTATRDFDTEGAGSSVGTGFVVDAELGLVLTNRHMVHAGPVTARAIFLDNEEAELVPIYRDPVHDFGIYRFDPHAVRFMQVAELELAPEAAKVGMEIRVVGNDAGEKLSILDGTLARLDRNAPAYGGNTYNDFNTFYYQAASNTSGGSSGSPVIDVSGRVVALNAGGRTEAASSFYLPLFRVARALALIQQGRDVPRGTLQATFTHRSYEELARLGLGRDTEAAVRAAFPLGSGALVVEDVVPGGPGDGQLRPGDVVVRIDGELATDFVRLDAVLDDRVGGTVRLGLERLGQPIEVELPIGDLHAITPRSYLEIGRAILHDLSYQQARNHDLPVRGVYIASSGYMFGQAGLDAGDLVTHVDGVPVPDLATLKRELETKADHQRIRVRHAPVSNVRLVEESVVTVDRTWFPMRTCERDDREGTWPCVDSPPPPEAPTERAVTATVPPTGDRRARELAKSLVLVDFDVPYSTEGVSGQYFLGTGVVVDAEQGLVAVDRDTVPVALGDLTLTFGGAVRVPGEVVWLHPVHNVAFVRYDPALVTGLSIEAVRFRDRWLDEGDKVRIVALDRDGAVVADEGEIEKLESLWVAPTGTPRFRDADVEVFALAKVKRSVGGVLVDKANRVLALWSSYFFPNAKDRYFYGLPTSYVAPILEDLRAGRTPVVRTPGFELRPRSLADARDLGLSDEWVRRFVAEDPEHPQVLEVARIAGDAPAKGIVRETDLLLTVDGEVVSRFRDLETWRTRERLELVLLRDGKEVNVTVPTVARSGQGVRRVVAWSGMLLHEPHAEVAAQQGIEADGVYVAWYWFGSPASRDGVRPTRRVVRVGDTPIGGLDDFLGAVRSLDPRKPVVLTLEDLDGVLEVRAVEPDPAFWPTEILELRDGRWTRTRTTP